jgi:hypothetical protein
MLDWPAVGWIMLALLIVLVIVISVWRLRRAGDTLRHIVEDEVGRVDDTAHSERSAAHV